MGASTNKRYLQAALALTLLACSGIAGCSDNQGQSSSGLRVKMCVWLGVSRGLDLAFLNAD